MSVADLGRVLVVIPTYNEAENLEPLVGRLRVSVPEADALVVDDGSPDGTGAIADRLAAADGNVHVLHRTEKAGLGAAYIAGFRWALAEGYDVVVEMDADGSHAPEELPRLLTAMRDADLVIGSRWVPGGQVRNWPMSRLRLTWPPGTQREPITRSASRIAVSSRGSSSGACDPSASISTTTS